MERPVVTDVARSLEDMHEVQSVECIYYTWHRGSSPARGGQVNTGEQKRKVMLTRNVWDEKWLRGLNVDLYSP